MCSQLNKKPKVASIGDFNGNVSGNQSNRLLIQEFEKINGALGLYPKNDNLHFSKGNILSLMGNDLAALECYQSAIEINDDKAEYHFNKGVLLHKTHQNAEAANSFKRALLINPLYPKAHYNLAAVEFKIGRFHDALTNFRHATTNDPNHLDAIIGLGKSFAALYQLENAVAEYQRALSIEHNNEKILGFLASAYVQLKEFQKSHDIFKKLTDLHPQNHEFWCGLGASLYGLNKPSKSMEAANHSILLKNDFADAHYNIGLLYQDAGNTTKSLISYKKALECDQFHKMSHNNLAQLFLSNFNFVEGWVEYDWRWQSPGFDSAALKTSKPIWQGEKSHKRLFIWAEQGIGDQILHGSILKFLENYPQEIFISIDPRLIPIFSRSFKRFTFIDKQLPLPESEYDEQIPLGSLAKIFIESISSLSLNKGPFLAGNSSLTSAVLSHLTEPGKILCGLSWKSSNKNIGSSKSLLLKELKPILLNPIFKFINLQYGQTSDEIKLIYDEFGVEIHTIDGLDLYDDIDGLASVISACDLVISSSNSTAHLSGALNKNTYLLTPKIKGKLWYWHDINGASPWYPSIQIFPQEVDGLWTHSVKKINSTLEKFFEK